MTKCKPILCVAKIYQTSAIDIAHLTKHYVTHTHCAKSKVEVQALRLGGPKFDSQPCHTQSTMKMLLIHS